MTVKDAGASYKKSQIVTISSPFQLSSMGSADIVIFLCALIATLLIYRRYGARSSAPYPPGPKPLPFIGNLHQFPSDGFEWIAYDKWCKQLNTDILFLSAIGNRFLVLNSMDSINDLLDKRSSVYSSRPKFPMAGELMGWKWMFAIMEYGESWKERRRVFTNYFNPGNSPVYEGNHAKYAREMLPVLRDNPENFLQITRHAVGGWALSMAYGFPIKRTDDPNVELAERALTTLNAALLPANFMVNIIPALMHIPEFFPGGRFKKQAREWKKIQEEMLEVPFNKVVNDMKSGKAKGSFTVSGLQGLDGNASSEKVQMIKESAGMVFAAAADTTLATIQTFFAAMLCFPEVQKKAQQELDRVLGGRLPELHDQPDLPYITALVKEVIRWKPIAPIGIPHTTTQDDIYRGYFIPKGTIVMPNSWSLLQDKNYYPDPESFKPERYLKNGKVNHDIRDPAKIIFGYGRRVCPGSHIALSFIWLMAASVLATFNISNALDEKGAPIEPNIKYHPGTVSEPLPFDCTIKPRSKDAERLIQSVDSE